MFNVKDESSILRRGSKPVAIGAMDIKTPAPNRPAEDLENEVRDRWHTLTPEQKQALFEWAEDLLYNEDWE